MTHDEAVKKLEGMVGFHLQQFDGDVMWYQVLDGDIRLRASGPEIALWQTCLSLLKQQGWVKVSERKPELYQQVFGYYSFGAHKCHWNGKTWSLDEAHRPVFDKDQPTHWQPLPIPPEEENDDGNS